MGNGRPNKFTREVTDKILYAIRLGAPYEMACNYAGCSYEVMRKWVKDAKENPDTSIYIGFYGDLKEAEGAGGLKCLETITKSMDEGAWQAAAWKLERRHPKHFSANAAVIELAAEVQKLKEMIRGKGLHGNSESSKTEEASEE